MNNRDLYAMFLESWSAETSYSEDALADNHPYGQCAATALVLHDLLGGTFRTAVVEWGSVVGAESTTHYWLVTPEGLHLDFTWGQFPSYAGKRDIAEVSRETLLPDGNAWMAERYNLLRERVLSRLEDDPELGPLGETQTG